MRWFEAEREKLDQRLYRVHLEPNGAGNFCYFGGGTRRAADPPSAVELAVKNAAKTEAKAAARHAARRAAAAAMAAGETADGSATVSYDDDDSVGATRLARAPLSRAAVVTRASHDERSSLLTIHTRARRVTLLLIVTRDTSRNLWPIS